MTEDHGSTSVVVLAVLLGLSVLFLGAGMFIEFSLVRLHQSEQSDLEAKLLEEQAESIVRMLLDDPTPSADSRLDPVWSRLTENRGQDGTIRVMVEDASSHLGLNWVRKELVESFGVLKPGQSAQAFQQFREDTGLHSNLISSFAEYFPKDDLESLFTAYSFFNINISDEFVLRKLHFVRGGDAGNAERFHTLIQEARIQKKQIEPQALEGFLGPENYALLFPILNAEPAMNLHFVPERVLKALFAHYQVPLDRAERIMALRQSSEWTPGDLVELFGKESYEKTPLRQYLGVRTWFWRIRIQGQRRALTWIVARLPGDEEPTLRLIEQRLNP